MASDADADPEAALAGGRWQEARAGFERRLATTGESAPACFGLATALWWLGENHESVARAGRAYALFRQAGDAAGAARCAVWLAIVYKSNFDNVAAANGWLARADRVLAPLVPGPLHGWVDVARAYRMADLGRAEGLTAHALELATAAADADLELVALAQLGLIRVSGGDGGGFALIDEAMAASLAGERSTLDTVVYICCDMLSACEVTSDMERAAEWCRVADDFVDAYGCPFLYAECRICYGIVLVAKGQWADAERQLLAGLRITEGACPGLHARALVRLAGLRIAQGRLGEADQLLARVSHGVEAGIERSNALAALALARSDPATATRLLEARLGDLEAHRWLLAEALDLLVEAHLGTGDHAGATPAVRRLEELAAAGSSERAAALASAAAGRQAGVSGDRAAATVRLEGALEIWSRLDFPFETARTRAALARVLAGHQHEVAVDSAQRALQAFEALGATLEADRTAALLRDLGAGPGAGPRSPGVLSRRELQVLRLLGEGLTNPEIGARLYVSRKTASHHVSAVLAKLNLRNRAEAAAYAAAMGTAGAAGEPDGE
ncbi:MAG TPA: LuxR C-terminal-related transcriptional regulator [Acidimicrobiales bacterium]|nr:LuxR C-terminal-related transcriptional regulator [Acidimicrobiales bacterium]HWH34154.1 LuxR C-terminal-related transcriptional regulator [Acidimicrobiales bacterium]